MISMKVNEVFQYLTATDEELLKKCHQCMETIVSAKDRQAAEANRHASILLEQLDREKSIEESKKAAAARKREKKRRKKKEKQKQAQKEPEKESEDIEPKESEKEKTDSKHSTPEPNEDKDDEDEEENDEDFKELIMQPPSASSSATTGLPLITESSKNQRHKRSRNNEISSNSSSCSESNGKTKSKKSRKAERDREKQLEQEKEHEKEQQNREQQHRDQHREQDKRVPDMGAPVTSTSSSTSYSLTTSSPMNLRNKRQGGSSERHGIGDLDDFGLPSNIKTTPKEKERNRKNMDKSSKVSSLDTFGLLSPGKSVGKTSNVPSPKKNQKKEEGWKEVTRKTCSTRSKKVTVPSSAISRVIGRGGCNINAIREASGAHIDVDKQKGSGDRVINIKGSTEATRQAHTYISALIKDPDKDLDQILPKARQKTLPVSQNNHPSFLSTASSIAPTSSSYTTAAHLFTTSVWNNSMANHITSPLSVATTSSSSSSSSSSIVTSLQQNKGISSSKASSVGTARLTTITNTSMSHVQAPFANIVRQSQSNTQRATLQSASPQSLQNGPVIQPSPKRLSGGPGLGVHTNGVQGGPKSPGSVARQLFPGAEKSINISTVKTSVTYSTVSMSKTKVVTATSQTFASKVENSPRTITTSKVQQKSSNASPIPISKSNHLPSSVKNTSEPQPLPIKSNTISSNRLHPSNQNSSGRQSVPVGPTEYSPFNNRFSHELEMLNKKEESKDFASVAAAGVVSSSNPVMSNVSPAPIDSQPDPTLQSKAPGYKGPGQRTSSPQISDYDPRSKPLVFNMSGLSPAQSHKLASTQNSQSVDHPGLENMAPVGPPRNYPHHISGQQMNIGEVDPSKAPGFKGYPDIPDPSSRISGFRTHGPMSYHNMSPRPAMVGPHANFSTLMQSHPRNEYSTPDQPMTLPKIESTLNPNAPDFTSRSYESSNRFPPMSGMGNIGYGPGFNVPNLAGLSTLPANLGQAVLGNQNAFRVPPPPVGSVMSQPPVLPSGEFLSQDMSSANGQLLNRFVNAALLNSGAMNVPTSISRPFQAVPQTGPSSATTPPVGASKRESPVASVVSEPSPSSSSAPSPTDQSGIPADSYSRQLRPIGTERAHKKPHVPGYPSSMGEAGAAGLWAYNTDISADWISSVMTTPVVGSSGVMTSGSVDGDEQRPASHPGMGHHVRPPSYPTPEPHMDQSLETQFGQAAVLIANSGGPAVIAANGVPPGAAAALPMAHLYTQAQMTADTLPSMWNQQVKTDQPGQEQPKMVRAHYSN